jgi:preprotein translocase subunit YajC
MFTAIGILYGLFWVALLLLLIYFAIRRVEAKQHEDFEKRDN